MDYDEDKVAEDVLALLFLTSHGDSKEGPYRAWKGHDFRIMDRLHEMGYISDPRTKAKSVNFTDEGLEKARELFEAKYGKNK
jgi:hypothetical protein